MPGAVERGASFQDFLFDFDKSDIRLDEMSKVAKIAAYMPAAKIQTGAFGESRLKCSESTEACWQRERRVEVLIGTDTASK